MDKEVKKILFLGVAAVLVLTIFIVIILGSRNNNDDSNSEDQYAVFPDSTTVELEDNTSQFDLINSATSDLSTEAVATTTEVATELFIPTQTDDWQDTIVTPERTTQIEDSPTFTTSNTALNPNTGEPFSRDDLIAQGIITDDTVVARNRFVNITEPRIFDENDPLLFPTIDAEPETLTVTRFKSCGTVTLGASESAIERYLSTIADTSEASCLGQAVANNCEDSRVSVSAFLGQVSGSVYVAERNDGECGVGVHFDGDEVLTLCSIADSLNTNLSASDQKTFTEWQAVFRREPGKTFASLISEDEFDIVNPVSCISYRL